VFEILATAIDILIGSVSLWQESKEKKQKAELANKLVAIYFLIQQITKDGKKILHALEYCLARYRVNAVASRRSWESERSNYLWYLERQHHNILMFRETLEEVFSLLVVYIPEIRDKIKPIIYVKHNALYDLIAILSEGSLPIKIKYMNVEDDSFMLSRPLKTRMISSQDFRWDDESYHIISTYLEERDNPHDQLIELEHFTEELRKVIVDNFSINDVLIAANDQVLKDPGI
jgi:hypothetical protein